ncbi:MAG: hypothetical protein ABI237_06035 [Ginsengibacter sp.]
MKFGNKITAGIWNGTFLGEPYGGTGQTSFAKGDLLYASATNVLSKLAAGTDGYVLTLASGVPVWSAASGGGTTIPSQSGNSGKYLTTDGTVLSWGTVSGGSSLPSQTGNAGKWLTTNGTAASWAFNTGWSTSGNAGTDGGTTNFLGTTDNKAFLFKTNNTKAFQVNTDQTTTFYNKLTVYDNTYNFIDYRRNVPNDVSIFRIYATGDFTPLFMTVGSSEVFNYSRDGVTSGYLSLNRAKARVQDNGSGITPTGSVGISNLVMYVPGSTSTPGIEFWNDYSLQCRRAQILAGSNGARSGYLSFLVNTDTNGLANSVNTESMRIMPSLNVLIGTVTDIPSALLNLSSTTKGFLPPRMTTTQAGMISTPAEGLFLYDSTLKKMKFFNGTSWEVITSV